MKEKEEKKVSKKHNTSQKKDSKPKSIKTSAKKNNTKNNNNDNEKKGVQKKLSKDIEISKLEDEIQTKLRKIDLNTETKTFEIIANNKSKFEFSLFEVILLIIITILSCTLIFSFIISSTTETKSADKNDIAQNFTKEDIDMFLEQYNYILNNYYGEIDEEQLLKDAIEGMFSSLDDYSQVIDQESNSFSITLTGEYEGVGISIYNDGLGNIVIQTIYEGTPAEKAGLKPNDIIVKFNDIDLTNVETAKLVEMISLADEMTLTIIRNEKEFEVKLNREKIVLNSVNSQMLENKIGYIDVDIFAINTPEQFENALNVLEKQGMDKLIIDLRDNTGGHLSAVEKMLYMFMNKNYIIYQTEDKNGIEKFYSQGKKTRKYDIVILQNGLSASASEIMASALKENLDAYIIGNTSFGKGTVQSLIDVDEEMQYKFTTKRWLTPNGNWINEKGIKPDLEVIQSTEYYQNPNMENDNQLQSAIKYLNNK